MHLTRIAALLLGAWLGGCVFMDTVATQNFRSVDRMLAAPTAMKERMLPQGSAVKAGRNRFGPDAIR